MTRYTIVERPKKVFGEELAERTSERRIEKHSAQGISEYPAESGIYQQFSIYSELVQSPHVFLISRPKIDVLGRNLFKNALLGRREEQFKGTTELVALAEADLIPFMHKFHERRVRRMCRLFVELPCSLSLLLILSEEGPKTSDELLGLEPDCHTVLRAVCTLFGLDLIAFSGNQVQLSSLGQDTAVRFHRFINVGEP